MRQELPTVVSTLAPLGAAGARRRSRGQDVSGCTLVLRCALKKEARRWAGPRTRNLIGPEMEAGVSLQDLWVGSPGET